MFVHDYNFPLDSVSLDMIEEYDSFLNELHERSLKDRYSLDCAARMGDCVLDYKRIHEMLTPELQEKLDLYIAACEEHEHSYIFIAYMMGRDHQRKGIPPARLLFSDRTT